MFLFHLSRTDLTKERNISTAWLEWNSILASIVQYMLLPPSYTWFNKAVGNELMDFFMRSPAYRRETQQTNKILKTLVKNSNQSTSKKKSILRLTGGNQGCTSTIKPLKRLEEQEKLARILASMRIKWKNQCNKPFYFPSWLSSQSILVTCTMYPEEITPNLASSHRQSPHTQSERISKA